MSPLTIELIAATLFAVALIHTFAAKQFERLSLTYLGSLITGISEEAKYSLVAGGGLSIIAHAPNHAGVALLKRGFSDETTSAGGLLLGALLPTLCSGRVHPPVGACDDQRIAVMATSQRDAGGQSGTPDGTSGHGRLQRPGRTGNAS